MFKIEPSFSEGQLYFKITVEKSNGIISKNISLKAFKDLILSIENDTSFDTGYLINSLKRHTISGDENKYLFTYPEMTINPAVRDKNYTNLFKDPYFELTKEDNLYTFNNFKVKNIALLFTNKNNFYSYRVCFYDINTIFNNNDVTDQTKFYPTFFPNHFNTSICWGGTQFSSILHSSCSPEGLNLKVIERIPFVYLNSTFNEDLFMSFYSKSAIDFIKLNQDLILNSLEEKLGRPIENKADIVAPSPKDLLHYFAMLKIIFDIPSLYTKFLEALDNNSYVIPSSSFFNYGI